MKILWVWCWGLERERCSRVNLCQKGHYCLAQFFRLLISQLHSYVSFNPCFEKSSMWCMWIHLPTRTCIHSSPSMFHGTLYLNLSANLFHMSDWVDLNSKFIKYGCFTFCFYRKYSSRNKESVFTLFKNSEPGVVTNPVLFFPHINQTWGHQKSAHMYQILKSKREREREREKNKSGLKISNWQELGGFTSSRISCRRRRPPAPSNSSH
jgi:hypothetical protein